MPCIDFLVDVETVRRFLCVVLRRGMGIFGRGIYDHSFVQEKSCRERVIYLRYLALTGSRTSMVYNFCSLAWTVR